MSRNLLSLNAPESASLYETVTAAIIADLENGIFPWVQPWGTRGEAETGMPQNVISRRPYSGINVLLLWGAVIERAFPTQLWLTDRQARDLGGKVRNGECATKIVYAGRFTPEKERERARMDGREPGVFSFLRWYGVYNVAQCEDLPREAYSTPDPPSDVQIDWRVREMIQSSKIDFRIGGNRAFYDPRHDYVQVPPPQAFFEPINWHRTTCHELTHSTAASHRLKRNLTGSFGSKQYAMEELIAEIGAAFLCAHFGIRPTVRHADYIGSWLQVLKNDKRAIFRAASQASKASNYLLKFAPPLCGETGCKEAA